MASVLPTGRPGFGKVALDASATPLGDLMPRRGRQRIKEFGRIGSRYDKTDGSFAAGVAVFLAVK